MEGSTEKEKLKDLVPKETRAQLEKKVEKAKQKAKKLGKNLKEKQTELSFKPDDDPADWSDERWAKYFLDRSFSIAERLPWDKILTSILFYYLWRKAYGKSSSFEEKKHDLALGFLYGFTVPEALKGGLLANTYALGLLGALGAGFIPNDVLDEFAEGLKDVGAGIPGFAGISQAYGSGMTQKEIDQYIKMTTQIQTLPAGAYFDDDGKIIYSESTSDQNSPAPDPPVLVEEILYGLTQKECLQMGGTYDMTALTCKIMK